MMKQIFDTELQATEYAKQYPEKDYHDLQHAFIAGVISYNNHLFKNTSWISVTDKVPDITKNENSEYVLVFTLNGKLGIGRCYTQNTIQIFWSWENTMPIYNVTHWMPLPEPPKKG